MWSEMKLLQGAIFIILSIVSGKSIIKLPFCVLLPNKIGGVTQYFISINKQKTKQEKFGQRNMDKISNVIPNYSSSVSLLEIVSGMIYYQSQQSQSKFTHRNATSCKNFEKTFIRDALFTDGAACCLCLITFARPTSVGLHFVCHSLCAQPVKDFLHLTH